MTKADQMEALERWRDDITARMNALKAEQDTLCSAITNLVFGRPFDMAVCPRVFRTPPAEDAGHGSMTAAAAVGSRVLYGDEPIEDQSFTRLARTGKPCSTEADARAALVNPAKNNGEVAS